MIEHDWNTSLKPLLWGFFASLALILVAYFFALGYPLLLVSLAIVQGIVQLIFFLHLGIETKPRWNLMIFLFMILIMVVILGGSIWIMRELNYNLMLPQEYGHHAEY